MSVNIQKGEAMRDDINRAVDTGIQRQRQITEWRKILLAILAEFDDMPDGYVIVIQGDEPNDSKPAFKRQMRITLGHLRGMIQP